jgi:hypothetical protein
MFLAADQLSLRNRQQGWVGLIGLLLALLIVAWLSRTLLTRLFPPAITVHTSGSRVPGDIAPVEPDVTTVSPNPRTELERAKGLQAEVQRQAEDNEKRMEEGVQGQPQK